MVDRLWLEKSFYCGKPVGASYLESQGWGDLTFCVSLPAGSHMPHLSSSLPELPTCNLHPLDILEALSCVPIILYLSPLFLCVQLVGGC